MRLRDLQEGSRYLDTLHVKVPDIKKATSSDWVYNTLLLEHLTDQGKAVAVMTNGSTWNSTDERIREYFITNGYIEAVISLPAKLFGFTAIPTTMIVMSKNNKAIRMIDAHKTFVAGRRQNELNDENIETIVRLLELDSEQSTLVPIEDFVKCDFNLNPTRFLEESIDIKNGVEFGTLIKRITRGAQLKATELDEMVSEISTSTQYLMLSNIQDGIISNELPYLKTLDSKYDKYCIGNRNLILSKNGMPFKVAVADIAPGQKVLGNGNLFIIEVDEDKVNPFFLKAFFDSEIGVALLQKISVGATIPTISAEALKKLTVPLYPIEEQNRIANLYQAKLDEIKILNLKMERAKNELRTIFEEG
jgi:type I restriction enzyme M protein